MDIDEAGNMDILLQRCITTPQKTRSCYISGIYNNYIFDSFYIKAMFLAEN